MIIIVICLITILLIYLVKYTNLLEKYTNRPKISDSNMKKTIYLGIGRGIVNAAVMYTTGYDAVVSVVVGYLNTLLSVTTEHYML